jgi:uracil-DNA glycosylase family 4
LERKAEKILSDLQTTLEFYSQLGIRFLPACLPAPSLEERILGCEICSLSATRKNAVPGEGKEDAELMFVGEAPGRDEDIQGRPFVGKAGQLLTKILKAMGLDRREVYITNVVKCRPPNNREPNSEEIGKCKGYLLEQIERINPKVIVTLGNVPTHFFVPSKQGVTSLRGEFYPYQDRLVMPTFHPSYLDRNEENRLLRKMVWEDMKKVMAFLGK